MDSNVGKVMIWGGVLLRRLPNLDDLADEFITVEARVRTADLPALGRRWLACIGCRGTTVVVDSAGIEWPGADLIYLGADAEYGGPEHYEVTHKFIRLTTLHPQVTYDFAT